MKKISEKINMRIKRINIDEIIEIELSSDWWNHLSTIEY